MSDQGFTVDGPDGLVAKCHADKRGGYRAEYIKRGSTRINPKKDAGVKIQMSFRKGNNGEPITKREFKQRMKLELKNLADSFGKRIGDRSPGFSEFVESTYKPEHIRRFKKDDFYTPNKSLSRFEMFLDQSDEYPDYDQIKLDEVDSYVLNDAEEWYEFDARHSVTSRNAEGKAYSSKSWQDMSAMVSRVIKRAIMERNRASKQANVWNLVDPMPHLSQLRPRAAKTEVENYKLQLWEKKAMLDVLWDSEKMSAGHIDWTVSDKLMASLQILCGTRTNQLLGMKWSDARWIDLDGERLVLPMDHSKAGKKRKPYLVVPHGRLQDEFKRHQLRSRGHEFVFWETAGCPESDQRVGNWAKRLSTLIAKIPGTAWPLAACDPNKPIYVRPAITLRAAAITDFHSIRSAHQAKDMATDDWDSINQNMMDNTFKIADEVYATAIDLNAEVQGKVTDIMFRRVMDSTAPKNLKFKSA